MRNQVAPLPHRPESIEAHKTRINLAIEPVIQLISVFGGTGTPIGLRPEHVFDYHDGMRLIVSREQMGFSLIHLHVSASAEPGSEIFIRIKDARMARHEFCELARSRFTRISGYTINPYPAYVSNKGIPHWIQVS